MRMIILSVLLMALSSDLASQSARKQGPSKRGSLYGWVIVIDPGHGGMDPGSAGIHNGQRVVEDEYVYDVAVRASRMIRERQGLAFMTIRDNVGQRSWETFRVFPDARTERFVLDGSIVRAGTSGLNKRLAYGNSISRKYPGHRQVWISIHFDVLGRNRDIDGVRIIATDPESRLSRELERSFGSAKRLRDDDPVVANGDPDHGIRRLYILGGLNRFREKVLIELGNFNNADDLWRIRNPAVREGYAKAIIDGLK